MDLEAAITAAVDRGVDEVVDVRREVHRRPELSFEEAGTTALLAGRLAGLGLAGRPCPTPTGAVALIEGGRPGADVMVRADIDGLPVGERTGLPFASEVEGVMHACGHDAHTAMLLGVAAALTDVAADLPGRHLLVWQPAEERVSGAQAMVDGGLLDGLAPAAVVGVHISSVVPTGVVATRAGLAMAGAGGLDVEVTGRGGHGALDPRRGNVVLAAARLADRLHTVVSGLGAEGTDMVCSPGLIAAGTAPNVVPTSARLAATLRWFDGAARDEAEGRLRALAEEVAGEFEVAVEIRPAFGTGPVRNDPAATDVVLGVVDDLLPGVAGVRSPSPVAASDDVSVLLDRVPGCYAMLGAAPADGTGGPHHSPTFAIDEAALRTGTLLLAQAAARLAARRTGADPAR